MGASLLAIVIARVVIHIPERPLECVFKRLPYERLLHTVHAVGGRSEGQSEQCSDKPHRAGPDAYGPHHKGVHENHLSGRRIAPRVVRKRSAGFVIPRV